MFETVTTLWVLTLAKQVGLETHKNIKKEIQNSWSYGNPKWA